MATFSERGDDLKFCFADPPSNPDAHSEKARTIIMNNIKRNSAAIKVISDWEFFSRPSNFQ